MNCLRMISHSKTNGGIRIETISKSCMTRVYRIVRKNHHMKITFKTSNISHEFQETRKQPYFCMELCPLARLQHILILWFTNIRGGKSPQCHQLIET